jgi:hypothetical protein
MTTRVQRLLGLAAASAGVGIVALPDSGPRLFSLSVEHGPSLVDTPGIVLVVAGWLALLASAPRAEALQWLREHRGCVGFAAGGGTGLLVASVVSGFGWWWLVGAALLAGVQVAAFAGARLSRA